MIKDDIYRWIGGILIGIGIFCNAVAISGIMAPPEDNEYPPEQYLTIMGVCTVVFLIPGIIIFAWGWKLGKKEHDLEKLAGYLKSYRRMKISDIARKMGKTDYETEDLIVQCAKQGLVKGYIDRSTGEFFTYESMFEEVKSPGNCPNCGAFLDSRILMGETAVCKFCGTRFTPPPVQRPYPSQTSSYQTQRGIQTPPPAYQRPVQYPPPPVSQPGMLTVKCLSCSKIFEAPRHGTGLIKCPFCGSQGTM